MCREREKGHWLFVPFSFFSPSLSHHLGGGFLWSGKSNRHVERPVEARRLPAHPRTHACAHANFINHIAQLTRAELLPAESYPLLSFCGAKIPEDHMSQREKSKQNKRRRRCRVRYARTRELANGGALRHGTAADPGLPTIHQAASLLIPANSAKGCGNRALEQAAPAYEAVAQ